jgi:hypothetical protein
MEFFIQRSFNSSDVEKKNHFKKLGDSWIDKVDDIIVWGIVVNHLPKLQEQVSTLLQG